MPLFGGQRLQSRNILIADLALALLLAYWADHPFSEDSRRLSRLRGRRGPRLEMVLAVLPPLAVIAVVTLGLSWGGGLLHWLRASPGAVGLEGALKPWLIPYALLGAGAIVFVIVGRRLRPVSRSRWPASWCLTWSCSRWPPTWPPQPGYPRRPPGRRALGGATSPRASGPPGTSPHRSA